MSSLKSLAVAAGLALGAMSALPAEAAQVLKFETNGCSFQGDRCRIAQTFGDTAQVDVSYRSITAATGETYESFLTYWGGGYGDLTGVAYGGSNSTGYISEITLKAAEGFAVSLLDFDFATFVNTTASAPFLITDLAGNTLSAFTGATGYPKHGHAAVNTAYLDGVILRWGPDGYNVGVNNLQFDARSLSVAGAVPEPSTWAMLILGFGALGSMMRRRRAAVASVPA